MKLILIPSGVPFIYDYLDRSIECALFKHTSKPPIVVNADTFNDKLSMKPTEHPAVALAILGDQLSQSTIKKIKDLNIQLAVWLTEDPFYIDRTIQAIQDYDIVFTIDYGAYKKYVSEGFSHVFHVPLATNPTIFHKSSVETQYENEVLLVGAPYPTRVQLVQYLLKHGDFQITVIGRHWHNRIPKKLRKHPNLSIINQWLDPKSIAKYYQGAQIVINAHRQSMFALNQNRENIKNETVNNRTFDIAACETFQLIENLPDLRSSFTEDEIIAYNDFNDCLDKINFYLKEVDLRNQIAHKAYLRAHQEHTFQQRIQDIMNLIQK